MNPETLLIEASYKIGEAEFDKAVHCHLCFWESRLCCFPTNHTAINHPVFLTFSEQVQRDGMTKKDWNILREDLWKVFKEKI